MAGTRRSDHVPEGEAAAADAGPLSLDKIIARFRGEWVLMRVTGHDEEHWPSEGYVLAHAPTQGALLEAEEKAPQPIAGQPYYAFFAEPFITSGPIYEAEVKRFFSNLALANPARRDRARN